MELEADLDLSSSEKARKPGWEGSGVQSMMVKPRDFKLTNQSPNGGMPRGKSMPELEPRSCTTKVRQTRGKTSQPYDFAHSVKGGTSKHVVPQTGCTAYRHTMLYMIVLVKVGSGASSVLLTDEVV